MIPSLLQIPSAVSDSKLHSVLPNNGKGDFTFDRSTGATRINKDGLIEEVGYFSSELVQNGNFSELGSELITNGDFSSASDWTLAGNISINNGKLVFDNAITNTDYAQQPIVAPTGKTYKITFTVSDLNSGDSIKIRFPFQDTSVNTNGTHTLYGVGSTANFIRITPNSSTGSFKIDNVSVKQVDPNDRWTAIGNSTLNFADFQGKSQVAKINITDTSTGARIRQPFNYVSGTKYKISVEVYLVSGSFRVDTSNSFVNINFVATSTTGSWITLEATYDAISTGSNYIWLRSSLAVAEFYVSNISIVEVQGDRPRLSYDITNGVVEDKPHLLLEPSRTNSIVFSTALQSNSNLRNSGASIETGFSSPDGGNNATRIFNFSGKYVALENTGTGHARSMYIKSTNGQSGVVYILDAGFIAHSKVTISGEWQRFELVSQDSWFYIVDGRGADTTLDDILVFGFQQENSATYATSYIPTAGTTITRSGETCNNSKPSVNSTEGVFYCEIAALANDSTDRRITISDGTTNNRMCIGFDNASNKIKYFLISSGSSQVNEDVSVSDITQFNKIAFKFKANDFKLYMNGSVIASDTSGSTFSANTLDVIKFAGYTGTTQEFYGKVKGLAVYNEALSESQLMQLTGVTASSIYSNFVTRTASFTVEALNEVKKVIDNL